MERGKVKFKYCRRKLIWDDVSKLRKLIWDAVSKLVQGGMTAHAAMDKNLETYGRYLTLTKLINLITRDKKNGAIPAELQV